jgi:hypothetical protein
VEEVSRAFPTAREKLGRIRGGQVSILGSGVGVDLADTGDVSPQSLLMDCLVATWDALKKQTPCLVVLVDDIQNFGSISAAVDTLRLVLHREEVQERTRFLFVLASTPDAWSGFIHKHHPVGRSFKARLQLERLDIDAAREVITQSLEGTGVTFSDEIIARVFDYSRGHPYELQLLSAMLYDQQSHGEVTVEAWEQARAEALRDLGMSHFDAMYRSASEQEREVLWVMSRVGDDSLAGVREAVPKLLRGRLDDEAIGKVLGNLNALLARLVQKGLIRKPDRGRYEIDDLMFRDYVKDVHEPSAG